MPKSKSKTEKLPPYSTHARTVLVNYITEFPDYQEKIKEGYPLRTANELKKIISRFSDGLTFEEINEEQAQKSPMIKLKKPTFRKYIQDALLPQSIGYRLVGKKRLAVFPKDVISHINFLYYFYQVADNKIVDFLLSLFETDKIGKMTLLEAIESVSQRQNIYADVYHYLCFDDGDISYTIESVLRNKPQECQTALKMLERVDEKFRILEDEISKLKSYLEQHTIKPSEISEPFNTE